MNSRFSLKAMMALLSIICISCSDGDMSKKELESLIFESLSPGSSDNEIRTFFDRHNWIYTYDRHSQRYQARDPAEDDGPTTDQGHQIYVYVDDEKQFVRAEVIVVFTAL